jgi:O-acetylhomoserine (thiol)-lyase
MAKLFDLDTDGYLYSRISNPTSDAVARKICALEGGTAAMLTASGQAAIFYAVFNIAGAGDHVVCSSTIYGGAFNLFAVTMKRMGIEFTFVSPDASVAELHAAFRPNTKAMYGETIANPALTVLDIELFAKVAHAHGVPLIVDNTFATPVNCRPFEWGADIVVHSTSKYMDGHASVIGGAIVDSGNFDWEAYPGKYPGLTEPDESYHGVVLYKAVRRAGRRVYPEGHGTADAGPRFDPLPSQRVPAETGPGIAARARPHGIAPTPSGRRIPQRTWESCLGAVLFHPRRPIL